MHLLTDYLFYNYYLNEFDKVKIYRDYDILNSKLINKYKVKLPEEVKDKVFNLEGKTQILHFDLACRIIDEVSKLNLEQVAKEANSEKWNKYKKLV